MMRERSASSGACREKASRSGSSDSVSRAIPGSQPTVETVVRRCVIPTSGSRARGGEHGVHVEARLAHAHEHEVVHRLDAAEVQHLVEDLGRGQVAPEAHRARGAERARQRAAGLRGDADGAAAVAVAHQHGLDRPAVARAEQRLDRAVARVRLVGELPASRTARARSSCARSARGQVGHRRVARRARGRPAPHLPRAEARAGRARRASRRGAPGPWPYGGSAMRLAKYLAHAGVASRRAAEQLVFAGRVTVGGEVVRDPARDVDGDATRSQVDGQPAQLERRHVVYALNKPAGYVSTVKDPQGRPTVVSLIAGRERLYPVGRLDVDTTGLLLLTNDGELAHRLTHPSYEVPRVYRARVRRPPVREPALRALRQGVELDDGRDGARAGAAARARPRGDHAARGPQAPGRGACSTRSAIPSSRSSAWRSGRCGWATCRSARHRRLRPAEVEALRRATRAATRRAVSLARAMRLIALRGANSVPENDRRGDPRRDRGRSCTSCSAATGSRPATSCRCLFTMTPDLDAEFPAVAARRMGLSRVPLMCTQEIDVPGAHAARDPRADPRLRRRPPRRGARLPRRDRGAAPGPAAARSRLADAMPIEFAERIRRIPVYPAAEGYALAGDVALLASNESPYPPLPAVQDAVARALGRPQPLPRPDRRRRCARRSSDRYEVPVAPDRHRQRLVRHPARGRRGAARARCRDRLRVAELQRLPAPGRDHRGAGDRGAARRRAPPRPRPDGGGGHRRHAAGHRLQPEQPDLDRAAAARRSPTSCARSRATSR